MNPEDILKGLPDAVMVVEPGGLVLALNPAAERLAGLLTAEAAGLHYGEVLPLTDAAGFLVHQQYDVLSPPLRVTTGTPERDYFVRRSDGTERWLAVRVAYVRDDAGRLTAAIVSLRDIGRRRRLDRARADLISTVSHEIRSPLTSVKGFTSTLLHRWERFTDEQKRAMLETINFDADRVTRLLGELLDVSRLEAGRLELKRQEVDIAEIAVEVITRVSRREEAEGHHLTADFAGSFPKVTADPGKIEQVLTNLVENAVKYATPGNVVVTGADLDRHAVVRVQDQGPGIEPKHIPHVFTKFYRRGMGERHSGTGLGLYICKGIVEAHGGEIWIERSSSEGTTFAFTLPKDPK